MGKDYYNDLQVTKDANHEDICKQFRLLSVKYHPYKDHTGNPEIPNNALAWNKFSTICEAYEVLSDHDLRQLYDQYGDDFTFPSTKGVLKGGYRFNGDSLRIFERFFGTENPFVDITLPLTPDEITRQKELAHSKVEDIIVDVDCTLFQTYQGCVKTITFERTVQDEKNMTRTETVEKKVEIKAGMENNTEIVYEGLGQQMNGLPPSNLIARIKVQPQRRYARKGNDIWINQVVSLKDALLASPVEVENLDGEVIKVPIDEMITPQTVRTILGKGMPICSQDTQSLLNPFDRRGNLYIKFQIEFPTNLTLEQKQQLTSVLEE